MITLKNVTIRRGKHILLENVSWTIYAKERIGIIGANGSGKSTLFSFLLQNYPADLGDLTIARHVRFSHVAQETAGVKQSALEYVLDGDVELRALESKLSEAERLDDGMKIAELHEQMGLIDAYTAPARAAQLLDGLGFSNSEQQRLVSDFSGGWRVRLNLARALIARSDVLLLDEPTNHLDLDAVIWLEQWLQSYQGTLIIISHDRDFLDATVDHIAHLHQQQLKIYTGNYSSFETLRASHLLLQQNQYEKQQKQLAHMQAFVERFRYKASKARQAQSRLKAIERMELICAVQSETPFQFEFATPSYCPNPLINLDDVRAAYGDHTVLNHINFSIAPKDRIAIIGPNGAGKSTFIKLLAGELIPADGHRHSSSGLKIGYFAQHQVDELVLTESPMAHFKRVAPRIEEQVFRKFLGGFGFTGDKVFEPVNTFSGGEKSRLALSLIVWQKPNLLLLDEPTNHLDLEVRNALSIALQAYEGAMILISHDRFLVRSTTDRLMLVANGALKEFDGDLTDYQNWLMDYRRMTNRSQTNEAATGVSKKHQRRLTAAARTALKPLLATINTAEIEIKRLQKEIAAIEAHLTDETLYAAENKANLQKYLIQLNELREKLAFKEEEWLAACEKRDELE